MAIMAILANEDRYVICQDAAKEMLAVAICDHYNRAKETIMCCWTLWKLMSNDQKMTGQSVKIVCSNWD